MTAKQPNKPKNSKIRTNMRSELKKVPRKTFFSILHGGLVSSDFFSKHKLKIFIAVVLVMIYISTKYQALTGMETIQRLERELEVVKTERIRERSHYMSRIRESSMAAIADSVRPGLSVQDQPPYTLNY